MVGGSGRPASPASSDSSTEPPSRGIMNLNFWFSGNEPPANPLPEALSNLIKSSKSDTRKPSENGRDYLVRIFKKIIPILKEARTMHWWSDKEYYRDLAPFRMERDLLPRIRRKLVELSQAMDPKKLKTKAEVEAARQLIYQISIDCTQLKISICMTWDPSKYKGSEDSLLDLPLYYYPDLPWGVDHVRDSIADLFETYSKPFQSSTARIDDKEDLGSLLELMDQMLRDLKTPRLAMQAKWRWMVRELDVIDHALVKCLKPKKVRKNNPLDGLEDDKHLEITQWCPRERMNDKEVLFIEQATPIIRLGRLLLNKLSKPTNSNPSLTSSMTMKELNELYISTDTIDEDLRVFAQLLLQVRRRQGGHAIKEISERLKKPPQLAKKHLDSLGSDPHRAEIKHGQEWCLTWLAHLDLAVERCIACCGFDDSDQWETDDSDT
ncbi:hypothetical protein MJO28_001363 [Puccinia striiformis f. sp. tritici]|uniref:Uncharacterized protein n=1 Tax=Puccinia striiformis f. sp. tritici TaxID=168172 RepID=A0ACC0EVC7_9BASI|nr:hypothetical protein Pst134EA_003372 [Puccinia striiformis f. sp. tritici]KAH9472768.1 hypothetical protein Pst134EA_003372 [Puccinia striiformis f. sp. tritici]KAI7960874.1 hypothetical protein MJO28_001363 [Puccinia striiformis f. sp. tritici]KAI7965644.1 hypothetical protein MJO29_001392 [Puccinia striiformis f. sp. tritici]KAI9619901.1 hypothetical protein KEM48_008395 [Puccinia striiformis f. sp. tritici PST-130]